MLDADFPVATVFGATCFSLLLACAIAEQKKRSFHRQSLDLAREGGCLAEMALHPKRASSLSWLILLPVAVATYTTLLEWREITSPHRKPIYFSEVVASSSNLIQHPRTFLHALRLIGGI